MPSLTKPLTVINMLYKDSIYIIQRDIAHIKTLGIASVLPSTASKALIGYAKLLGELRAAHMSIEEEKKARGKAKAKGLSEEELKALVK
jgi:hypothetical protein